MSLSPAEIDLRATARAVTCARDGHPSPNPHVGAVVVRDGEVVGEGWHERAGGDHAEVIALRAAGERARAAENGCWQWAGPAAPRSPGPCFFRRPVSRRRQVRRRAP